MNTKNKQDSSSESKVVLYTNEHGEVELRADSKKDTLWASQEQIASIFDTTKQNVGQHLKNIFSDQELNEISVVKDFFTTAKDCKRYLTKCYSLDAIIAVGYRVNSKKATKFRMWATNILRNYVTKGYALNTYTLNTSEGKFDDLHEAIAYIESKTNKGSVKGEMTLKVVKDIV